jgi:RHS repeat-associated protein
MLDNIGLIHMNGRVQDPLLGRFVSPDPFIDGELTTQGWNRYAYVRNNPQTLTDPSGYTVCSETMTAEECSELITRDNDAEELRAASFHEVLCAASPSLCPNHISHADARARSLPRDSFLAVPYAGDDISVRPYHERLPITDLDGNLIATSSAFVYDIFQGSSGQYGNLLAVYNPAIARLSYAIDSFEFSLLQTMSFDRYLDGPLSRNPPPPPPGSGILDHREVLSDFMALTTAPARLLTPLGAMVDTGANLLIELPAEVARLDYVGAASTIGTELAGRYTSRITEPLDSVFGGRTSLIFGNLFGESFGWTIDGICNRQLDPGLTVRGCAQN